jgi:hypothetical protein
MRPKCLEHHLDRASNDPAGPSCKRNHQRWSVLNRATALVSRQPQTTNAGEILPLSGNAHRITRDVDLDLSALTQSERTPGFRRAGRPLTLEVIVLMDEVVRSREKVARIDFASIRSQMSTSVPSFTTAVSESTSFLKQHAEHVRYRQIAHDGAGLRDGGRRCGFDRR